MFGVMFPGGLASFDEDDGTIHRALIAWEFAKDGRSVQQTRGRGYYRCALCEIGQPDIVATSRRSKPDAAAQALSIADSKDYQERYGSDQYKELSRLLVDLQLLATE